MSTDESPDDMVEMQVAGLVLDPSSNAPIVILKDLEGGVALPIWIGLNEATAIASALKKIEPVRPMTHDLLKTVIDEFGARIVRVVIRALEESTFLASIEIVSGEVFKEIDSRPSDALALAVRAGAAVFVSHKVLAQAQLPVVTAQPSSEEGADTGSEAHGGEEMPGIEYAEDGVELVDLHPNFAEIDKTRWEELLAGMDPDDFKYKM